MNIPRLTLFEKTRVIGQRATQLAHGAPITIPEKEYKGIVDPILIAEKEYMAGTIPICVIRTLPNGTKIKISFKPKKKVK